MQIILSTQKINIQDVTGANSSKEADRLCGFALKSENFSTSKRFLHGNGEKDLLLHRLLCNPGLLTHNH